MMSQELKREGFVLVRHAASGRWLRFESPCAVITARTTGEVVPALRRIEELVNHRRWHAAGFISYEAAGALDGALTTHAAGDFPLVWFGLYEKPEAFSLPEADARAYALGDFLPTVDPHAYTQAIQRIQAYIHAGDTYQVNYTLRLRARFAGDAWHLFLALAHAQPSGYAAFIDTGRFAVCSASPELFFLLEGRRLVCKPMKGTAQRGRTTAEDAALAAWLQQSEKNRAENLMIVDMIRNDLGRVADVGSVRVPALFEIERHPTLWQMTSTVTADCGRSWVEILAALFPCASITGAPKIRTAAIIRELEPHARHLYTGSIGWLAPERRAQFSVAIRTALVDRQSGQAEYGAGGGIVIDSVPEEEYAEALLKARIFTETPEAFSLLETMRWSPEEDYFLLAWHLQRLTDSAGYFDFPVDLPRVRMRLSEAAQSFGAEARRVRLLVHRDGSEEIQSEPLRTGTRPLRVRVARNPVRASDVFLYHKTTRRRVYEQARADFADCDDVLLWNERGELTESCIANLVVELEGERVTPPVASGLLPGTFRAWLLQQGAIRERVLLRSDLGRCTGIFLVNSVRKWQEAVLCT